MSDGSAAPVVQPPHATDGTKHEQGEGPLVEVPSWSLHPVISRALELDRTTPWASDAEYFEAVVACETARITASRLKYSIVKSVFTVDSKLFAATDNKQQNNGSLIMSGVKLAELMEELTLKIDAIRKEKLAVMKEGLPLLEQFLKNMRATEAESKLFRLVMALSSGISFINDEVDDHCDNTRSCHLTVSNVINILDDLSIKELMDLLGARSKWVAEKFYRRTRVATATFTSIPNDAMAAFMGLELSLSQYQGLESKVLQQALVNHAWFQETLTGKAVVNKQNESAKDNKTGTLATAPPAPLVAALAPASESKTAETKPSRNSSNRVFKALSKMSISKLEESYSGRSSKRQKVADTKLDAQDEFGPYKSELDYLEDQVHFMRMLVAHNRARHTLDMLSNKEYSISSKNLLPSIRRRLMRQGNGSSSAIQEDLEVDYERQAQQLDCKLKRLQAKISTKLLATKTETGRTPRLEQLCEALHLDKVERLVILDLVMSVIMPSDLYQRKHETNGQVGKLIKNFSTSLEEKMRCRKYFYKSATLVKEGILTITEGDFMTDLTQCFVSLDRRMFDFIVGLDTEFSELVDGSHLYSPTVSLEDVVLNDETKKRVCDCVSSFEGVKDEYQRLDISDKISYGLGHVLLFYGASGTGKTMLANAVAAKLKKKVLLVNFPSLGSNHSGAIIKFMFREARINNALLFFDECESIFMTRYKGSSSVNMILSELEQFEDLCILCTNRPADLDEAMHRRITLAIEFQKPDHLLREKIWSQLHPPKLALDDDVDFNELARKFTLTGGLIKNAWLVALGLMVQRGGEKVTQDDLIQAAKEQVIGTLTLEDFDLRAAPTSGIETVIVSDSLKESLSNIVQHTKAQSVLFGQWGFGKLHRAPTGISALFCGPPGTGKSMAAEAIGFDLGMPLKVVNMAALFSKWVGETGKSIQAVFDDAKKKNAVLVFEEAEGLFGKRSTEASTSRHDNMNVGLLLQNIENFPGVCVVVTNLKKVIDQAFFRRFQFILDFEPPAVDLRTKLWKSIVPKECPLAPSVSFQDLSRKYEMCGGNIKSALFRAASRAALRGEVKDRVITMKDLEDSCSEEMKSDGGRAHLDMYN